MNTDSETSDEFLNNKIDDSIDLKAIAFQYLRHWRWFALSILVMLTLGYIYGKSQIPQYNVNIKLLIKDKEQSNDKDLLQQLNLFSSDKIIDNEIQILRTNMLMEKVISSMDIQNTYIIENRFAKEFLYKDLPFKLEIIKPSVNISKQKWIVKYIDSKHIEFNDKRVEFNHPVQTDAGLLLATPKSGSYYVNVPIQVNFGNVEAVAQNYINKLTIVPASKQSTVLSISMEDEIPQRGKDILTKLVDEYNQMSIEDKNKTTANTLAFINERLSSVAQELNGVEKNVENYKSANQIVDIGAQSTIFLGNVQANDTQITKIDLEFGALNNLQQYLSSEGSVMSKLPAMQGIEDPTLLSLVQQITTLIALKESKLRTMPETNPIVASMNDQIAALKKSILQTVANVRSGLEDNKKQLQTQNAKAEALIKNVPAKERGLIDVMRDRDIKNNLFTFLLQKREETLMSMASTVSDSKTIDKAQSSGMYFRPAKNIIYISFFSIGILLPLLSLYLKYALNNKVARKYDIERSTRVPVLGQIGHSDDLLPLVAIEYPRSMVAEQIRALRTNLEFVFPLVKQKVILFTSSISGEGKSFVSLNLSASIASTGKKVIILELDLRKPRFSVTLGINNDSGLSNYLIGKSEYKDIIKQIDKLDNLHVITSGIIPPNPAELLLNGRIEALLVELKKEYDYIIIDAPPIGLLTDAQILSPYADVTLFVVRYDYTLKDSIKAIEELRYKKVFKRLNIVFNSIDYKKSNYGYGYGYGYGYYEESTKQSKPWWKPRR